MVLQVLAVFVGLFLVTFLLVLAVAYFVIDHLAERQYRDAMQAASRDDAFARDARRFAARREHKA